MTIDHDLRGRQFEWSRFVENPTEWRIVEDPVELGHLIRVPDLRPVFFATFAGFRIQIDHTVGVLGPIFEVRDADSSATLLKSFYTREAELRAVADDRTYSLRRASGVALWNDGFEDVVSLRHDEAFVLMGADPRDAAALVLLGIVMAIENTLFPAR